LRLPAAVSTVDIDLRTLLLVTAGQGHGWLEMASDFL